MGRRLIKGAALTMLLGTVFGWGGCLGNWGWRQALWVPVSYGALELLTDNDMWYDVFESGAEGTARMEIPTSPLLGTGVAE